MENKRHKVLFAGIDGSGKTTCLNLLVAKLEERYSIIKIGNHDPYFFYQGTQRSAANNKVYKIMDWLRPVSQRFRCYGLFLVVNFTYKHLLAKYVEWFKRSDIIMYETDVLLHPVVYIRYHFPVSRWISGKLRFKIVKTLFGPGKDCSIFYLDTSPEVAMDRILSRGGDIHEHENTRDLKKLKVEFDSMLEVVRENGFDIVRVNTNGRTLDEVLKEIQGILEEKLNGAAA